MNNLKKSRRKKYIKIGNNDLENEREFYKRKKSSQQIERKQQSSKYLHFVT